VKILAVDYGRNVETSRDKLLAHLELLTIIGSAKGNVMHRASGDLAEAGFG
jgi:hypothetical protein